MKKIFVIFSILMITILGIFLFTGCSKNINFEKRVSDIRYRVFDGEFEYYSVNLVCGLREKPYYPDGIANDKVEFAIISVVFTGEIDESETVYCSLKINGDIYSGVLEKSPYTDQYMADIEKIFDDNDEISIEIYFNESISSIYNSLTNRNLDWDVDYNKALSNGITALSEEIGFLEKSGLTYEIQVKILTEQKSSFGEYFWSVSLISSAGTRNNVVFSTNSTDILVKN